MKIRQFETGDLEQLVELFDSYRVFYHKESDKPSAKIFLSERLQHGDSQIYVCENNEEKLVGFIQLYPLFSSTRMKKLWLLNDLFVNSDHRGQGISRKLIKRSKKLAQETAACGLFLETDKSNLIGNNLYSKTGFKLNKGSNFYEWNNN